MFYVDSLLDVMDTSTLYLHQHQLLGVGLCDLLHCCRVSHLTALLDLVHSLLIRHRIVYKRASVGHDKTQPGDNNSVLLYCRAFLPVCEGAQQYPDTPTPTGDLAAGFTLLLCHSPPGGQTGVRETVKDCFLHFGCSEHVNATISCRYLCHMMPNKDVMSQLEVALANHESRLIQAWLQCSCLLPTDTSMLQELTRLVLKLGSVQQIFSKADIDTTNSSDDLKSKTEMRCEIERYLQGVPGCVSVVLKTSSMALHHNICLLTGWLVRHCAAILYVKTSLSESCRVVPVPDSEGLRLFFLQMMLEAARDHPETTDRTALAETLKGFLAHMKGSHGRVLKVLESVSVLCPSIVVDVIAAMTQAVKTSESLRGVGVDKELRLAYHSVLKNLGSHGNEEWSSLLLDS
ncbi:hypothetical protein NP493_71g05042 [Ridgeia piscesae]|uniref:MMS22-like C-terminal domain-containing protein n=1 Tax=Ridgeia piscesae TaxID=27915 RepID=A0AAD9P9W3_RIDPI|nr:hypothetical protein NP493_71g05042 [Ridgeia piscesae]